LVLPIEEMRRVDSFKLFSMVVNRKLRNNVASELLG
jgi:hypothetical protein